MFFERVPCNSLVYGFPFKLLLVPLDVLFELHFIAFYWRPFLIPLVPLDFFSNLLWFLLIFLMTSFEIQLIYYVDVYINHINTVYIYIYLTIFS